MKSANFGRRAENARRAEGGPEPQSNRYFKTLLESKASEHVKVWHCAGPGLTRSTLNVFRGLYCVLLLHVLCLGVLIYVGHAPELPLQSTQQHGATDIGSSHASSQKNKLAQDLADDRPADARSEASLEILWVHGGVRAGTLQTLRVKCPTITSFSQTACNSLCSEVLIVFRPLGEVFLDSVLPVLLDEDLRAQDLVPQHLVSKRHETWCLALRITRLPPH